MPTPEHAVLLAIGTCLGGVVLAGAGARARRLGAWTAFAATAVAAFLALGAAWTVLHDGAGSPGEFLSVPELRFAVRLHVDGLTAAFLVLAAVVSVAASLHSVRYLDRYPAASLARYHTCFLLFLAAMYGLVSTTDMMWFFLVFWQMMTLPGYLLIALDRTDPAHARAARRYLVMMQIACAATLVGAHLVAVPGGGPGRYEFEAVRQHLPALLREQPTKAALAFSLFLAGFGIKLGLWPFGRLWLPDAHPAAPSPVSAMLSGVMIKTGIYGLVRYFIWLVPLEARDGFPFRVWGTCIVALGAVTLFTGTVQALHETRLKRLLAFSSIGQAGYIVLGTGVTLLLLAPSAPASPSLAALALTGALFHVLNHGVFKALLFLDAGAVIHATGTQDLDRLGGLIRPLPLTGLTALVATLSVAGVPMLGGFASKWCIFQATFRAGSDHLLLAVAGAVAVVTSALTLVIFLKFFGTVFLGRTSPAAQAAHGEVPATMWVPQVLLATLCVLAGFAAVPVFHGLEQLLAQSAQGMAAALIPPEPAARPPAWTLGAALNAGVLAPLAITALLGAMLLLSVGWMRLGRAARRSDPPWLCGYAADHPRHAYRAGHFLGGWPGWLARPTVPASAPAPATRSPAASHSRRENLPPNPAV